MDVTAITCAVVGVTSWGVILFEVVSKFLEIQSQITLPY